jgi:hypothetical protein
MWVTVQDRKITRIPVGACEQIITCAVRSVAPTTRVMTAYGTLLSRLSRAACPELAKADATEPLAVTDVVIE